jgi:universal stress protein A
MTRRILCPIDFSETSADALRHADDLAKEMSAELVVAHAFKRPATWDIGGQTEPASEAVRAQIEAVTCDTPFTRVLHAGPPGPVICWLAQENECDLIVMGTHGHTGLKHLLFGSTAEYVLQHARCPVLSVRQRASNEPRLEEPIVMPLPGPGA